MIKLTTNIFGESTVKNRRLTPQEYADDLELAKLFCRPPRNYLYDLPFYPYLPPTPIANFDLKYKY